MFNSKFLAGLFLLVGLASAQTVGTIGVTNLVGGTGYPANATVTFSGCSTAPTGTPTVVGGVITAVQMTYVGVCSSAPTVAFAGTGGSGASATAVLMGRSIIVVSSLTNFAAAPLTVYTLACWLTVPSSRTTFYANKAMNIMPGTSQTSVFTGGTQSLSALETAAFQSGLITEQINSFSLPVGTAAATIETAAVSTCGAAQSALSAWNPWSIYGTNYNGATWNVVTVQ